MQEFIRKAIDVFNFFPSEAFLASNLLFFISDKISLHHRYTIAGTYLADWR